MKPDYHADFVDPGFIEELRTLPWHRSARGYDRMDIKPPYSGIVALLADLLPPSNHCVPQRYCAPWVEGPWHTDEYTDVHKISDEHPISIVSFGRSQTFEIDHGGEISSYDLEPGSVLIMPAGFQKGRLHRLAPTTAVEERISVSFTWRGQ